MRVLNSFVGAIASLVLGVSHAGDLAVTGTDVSGHAGERVYLNLTYDYGAGLGVIAEDLDFQFAAPALTLVPSLSTIDLLGTPQPLHSFALQLQQLAQAHFGSVLENANPKLGSGLGGYSLSFQMADGTAQDRSGRVHLKLAFDIAANALPGKYSVSFAGSSIADLDGNEFPYPAALNKLNVNVISTVPAPPSGVLMLLGLGAFALNRRLRRTG